MTTIEDLFKSRGGTLSVKTVARELNLKRRYVSYYCRVNKGFVKCRPYQVGSRKHSVNCFTFTD